MAKVRAIRHLVFFPLALASTIMGLSVGDGFPILCGAVGSVVVGPMFFLYILERSSRWRISGSGDARIGVTVILVLLMALGIIGTVLLTRQNDLLWASLVTLSLYFLEFLLAREILHRSERRKIDRTAHI